MYIADFSVRRAVAATMMVLIVIVLGVTSFFRIPIDLLPDLTFPVGVVITEYEGVGPEEIENSLTKIIEGAASRVDGLKEIRSVSERGVSLVVLEFEWGTNMDLAVQNIREELDQIPDFLFPDDADKPRIARYDPADIPLMGVGISGGGNNAIQLEKITEDYIEDPITGRERSTPRKFVRGSGSKGSPTSLVFKRSRARDSTLAAKLAPEPAPPNRSVCRTPPVDKSYPAYRRRPDIRHRIL